MSNSEVNIRWQVKIDEWSSYKTTTPGSRALSAAVYSLQPWMNQGMVHVVLQYSGAGHSTGHKGSSYKNHGMCGSAWGHEWQYLELEFQNSDIFWKWYCHKVIHNLMEQAKIRLCPSLFKEPPACSMAVIQDLYSLLFGAHQAALR